MDVVDLPRERFAEASSVMADAYLDDPGWVSVGPRGRARRHAYARRLCDGALAVVARWGGRIWQVERDGAVAGVLSSVDPGQWPPPQLHAIAYQALGPTLAGPAVLWRSLAADALMHEHHPHEPHLYVWMLAVAPEHQRTGVGRALLTAALARAEELATYTYLETANPDNLPYYASFGFRQIAQARLPGGAPIWWMDTL
ncbi:MAG TPA: GNAT family N-acetyltransferase [Thermoleophilaceae bacterium]|nr:GNAT family N-acetyltransferase [Thermoleophilaceae bacterium]